MSEKLYNPLDKLNLGKSVAEALLDRPSAPLGNIDNFDGAGIYAIYYAGPFGPYEQMAKRNADSAEWPIYIGKAIPPGGRKGTAIFERITGRYLCNRLREHADTIRAATNLDIVHFSCRYLVIDDIWIPLAETLLISTFRPLWNRVIEGFGNHDPGAGRYNGLMPIWDLVHPGRAWAPKCRPRNETADHWINLAMTFLEGNQPPDDPHMRFKPPGEFTIDDLEFS